MVTWRLAKWGTSNVPTQQATVRNRYEVTRNVRDGPVTRQPGRSESGPNQVKIAPKEGLGEGFGEGWGQRDRSGVA